jgi:hypothetical protein
LITLPDPDDIQVATGHREVEVHRAALRRVLNLRASVATCRGIVEEMRPNIGDTEYGRRLRDEAVQRYRDRSAELAAAEAELRTAVAAAEGAAPAASERARLSVDAYRARLRRERAVRER